KNYLAAFAPGLAAAALQRREQKKLNTNSEIEPAFMRAFNNGDCSVKPFVNSLNDVLYYNTVQNGLEQLLCYAERNSMAHGLDLRLPFLSHELAEFLFSIPGDYKIRQGSTKWILRESIKNELPATVSWRKDKIGFAPPQMHWMNQPSF